MSLTNLKRFFDKRNSLIFIISLTLWCYGTVTDLLIIYYQQQFMVKESNVVYVDMGSRVLQHLLLFPLLLAGYHLALRLYTRSLRPPMMWAVQVLLAFAYGMLVRPLFFISIALLHGRADYFMGETASIVELLTSAMFLWISSAASYFVMYLLGLFLLLTTLGRLELAEERLRLERLSTEWLAIKLKTLQWQINPHFLFNSLNTVSSLLRSAPGRADQVLAKFSELLRMTLREQEYLYTSVSNELEYIHRYLEMEMVRFEDRLKLQIEADERAMAGSMPTLLLQPLIENAIKHGVARIPGPATITVSVTRKGTGLLFEVRNTSSREYAAPQPTGTGLGIRNLQERLSTIYRDSFRFHYGYTKDGDWDAIVEIPYVDFTARNAMRG